MNLRCSFLTVKHNLFKAAEAILQLWNSPLYNRRTEKVQRFPDCVCVCLHVCTSACVHVCVGGCMPACVCICVQYLQNKNCNALHEPFFLDTFLPVKPLL